MKVICLGLSRTGTFSTKLALEILLEAPCYHGYDFLNNSTRPDLIFWRKVAQNKDHRYTWRDYFDYKPYIAALDVPIFKNYKKILSAFPKAKVILTIRNPKNWYKSFKNCCLPILQYHHVWPLPLTRFLNGRYETTEMANEWFSSKLVDDNEDSLKSAVLAGEGRAIALFEDWIRQIKATVPKDQLLLFDVKQGWEPLCNFLEIPHPPESIDFPHGNNSISMMLRFRGEWLFGWLLSLFVPLFFAFAFNFSF